MSYDVSLKIETGAGHVATVYDANMTCNVAPMWRAAGADLADMDGQRASEVAPVLAKAVEQMRAQPDTFRAMNPPNGWGDYDGCLAFLDKLANACRDHPLCVLSISL